MTKMESAGIMLRPHPRVTASPLSLEEPALAGVSKDGCNTIRFSILRDARRCAPQDEVSLLFSKGFQKKVICMSSPLRKNIFVSF
jgi:hypothetical protein